MKAKETVIKVTETKPVKITITLDNVLREGKSKVACECIVDKGDDEYLNVTAFYLSSILSLAVKELLPDAMQAASKDMAQNSQGIH